jgi:hypothetical protein
MWRITIWLKADHPRSKRPKTVRFTTWGKGGTLPAVNLDSNAAQLARMDGLDDQEESTLKDEI